MDTISQTILNLGVAGAVVAVFLVWVHRTTTVTIPGLIADREKDLSWAREQLDHKRQEYLTSLRDQQLAFQAALKEQRSDLLMTLERNEERWKKAQEAQEAMTEEIHHLADELRTLREEWQQADQRELQRDYRESQRDRREAQRDQREAQRDNSH